MRVEHDCSIDGAFKGWTGNGVYRLTDGSVWKQVNYLYQYQYLYRPAARIVNDGGRLYLEVEGIGPRIEVRRGSSSDIEDDGD